MWDPKKNPEVFVRLRTQLLPAFAPDAEGPDFEELKRTIML